MSRTNATRVNSIIEVDPTITDLTPFIDTANRIVDSQCAGIDETTAEDVETWLAAHLITIRDNRAASETAKGVGQSYQYKLDLGLACSMYGQTAMALDPTGGLARWNKQITTGKAGKKAGVAWAGTEVDA